ncbi:MAG: hypothetical protein ABUT39_00965 [Acidobacteriota bacterium]
MKRKSILFASALCTLIVALGMAAPAFANSAWDVEFEFDGPGRPPSVVNLRNYILGCVPRGSFVPNPPPPRDPEGPFSLTTPPVRGRELTDNQVYNYLNGCRLKPASVTGISVTGED